MDTELRESGFRTEDSETEAEVALCGDIATMRALDGPIV
jgi:hypothetical protein